MGNFIAILVFVLLILFLFVTNFFIWVPSGEENYISRVFSSGNIILSSIFMFSIFASMLMMYFMLSMIGSKKILTEIINSPYSLKSFSLLLGCLWISVFISLAIVRYAPLIFESAISDTLSEVNAGIKIIAVVGISLLIGLSFWIRGCLTKSKNFKGGDH